MTDNELLIKIRLDLKDIKKRLPELEKGLKQSTDTGRRGVRFLDSSFLQLFRRIAAGAGVILAFRKALDLSVEAKNVARDAQEIDSKFRVVFRGLEDETEAWVNSLGLAVGRARQDIKQWVSELQDTFVPLGMARDKSAELSKELVKLGLDLASFNNVADYQAISDIAKGILGESEAVRKYGIVIRETALREEHRRSGIKKTYAQLTELEKVQLRYNIILRSTKDAQGDLLRTQESLANLEKRRDALRKEFLYEMGNQVNPLMERYVQLQIKAYNALKDTVSVKLSETLKKDKLAMDALFAAAENANTSTATRTRIIRELNDKYKDYLPQLIDEKASLEDIKRAHDAVTQSIMRRISVALAEEEIAELSKKNVKWVDRQYITEKNLMSLEEQRNKALDEWNKKNGTNATLQEALLAIANKNQAAYDNMDTKRISSVHSLTAEDEALQDLNADYGRMKVLNDEANAKVDELRRTIQEITEKYNRLGSIVVDEFGNIVIATDEATDATKKYNDEAEKTGHQKKELKEIYEANWKITGSMMTLGDIVQQVMLNNVKFSEAFTQSLKVMAAQALTFALIWQGIKMFGTGGADLPSFGKFILGSMFGAPGFAEGTSDAPGGLSIVGEKGWELVNLPPHSQVYTHSQSKNIISNMLNTTALERKLDQVIVAIQTTPPTLINSRIKGQDIALVLERNQKNKM